VSTIGTTSSTAVDPIVAINGICATYGCWHHIDASYAGTALLLPENASVELWYRSGRFVCIQSA